MGARAADMGEWRAVDMEKTGDLSELAVLEMRRKLHKHMRNMGGLERSLFYFIFIFKTSMARSVGVLEMLLARLSRYLLCS